MRSVIVPSCERASAGFTKTLGRISRLQVGVHIPSRCILTPSNRLRGSTDRRHSLPSPHKAKTGPTSTVAKSISRFQARAFRSWHRPPPNLYSLQAESVDVAVVRANINHPIRHGGRGVNSAAGGVAPQLGACLGVQRVHVFVVRAEINH